MALSTAPLPGPEAGPYPTGTQGREEREQRKERGSVAGRREEGDYREAIHADEGGEENELRPPPGLLSMMIFIGITRIIAEAGLATLLTPVNAPDFIVMGLGSMVPKRGFKLRRP